MTSGQSNQMGTITIISGQSNLYDYAGIGTITIIV